jgi:hypothetical protein
MTPLLKVDCDYLIVRQETALDQIFEIKRDMPMAAKDEVQREVKR